MGGESVDAEVRRASGPRDLGSVGSLTDGPLLERYLSCRDEAAFAALVARHGPMVLRVCRGVLDDPHEAQDAFQATFLVLAREARSIRRLDSAASWLHGVARRVAAKAKVGLARRRRHERRVAAMSPEGFTPAGDRDDLRALDEEIGRLPAAPREVVVLCYLEGMTYEMAAGHLGVTEATVRGRLARARERLRHRLSRRGLAIPAGLAVAWGAPEAAVAAAVPARLADSAVNIARSLMAGKATPAVAPGSVAALAEGVMKAMFLDRMRWAAVALIAIGIPATGAIVLAQRDPKPPRRTAEEPPRRPAADPAPGLPPPAAPAKLAYGDGKPDGKKSLGGSGEMIEFALPADGRKVAGLRVHGSRYGQASPPDESFLIYFLDQDQSEVVATRMAPYSLFERGPERWVEMTFPVPVEVPGRFWVALDFRPHQSKGVYVSFDASTGGKHSRSGLPGIKPREVDFGDWMVEVVLAK